MGIRLDHLIVPSRDRRAAAARLAGILGMPWSEQASGGPFSAVYVNSELTLDLAQFGDEVPPQHYCFHVDEAQFDAILGRLREQDIAYRSTPLGPVDMQIKTYDGGRLLYWSEPDGHAWEILTASYARQPHEDGRD